VSANDRVTTLPEQGIDLFALWRVVWDDKWIVSAITLLCIAAAVVFALTATPMYRAQIVVTDAPDPSNVASSAGMGQLGGLASLAGFSLPATGSARDSSAILESRRLVEEFIKRNVPVEELIKNMPQDRALWLAVERFRRDVLSINKDDRKGKTAITIEWTDAATAARWANQFVELANDLIRRRALDEANRNIEYLNEQIGKTSIVEIRSVMYNLIESETRKLMLANGRVEYAFTVVDPAVPPKARSRPQRTLLVMLGALLGAAAGVAIAFVRVAMRGGLASKRL
jgi:uncharacterized protein involved in exopolysaccharide biosynthesis